MNVKYPIINSSVLSHLLIVGLIRLVPRSTLFGIFTKTIQLIHCSFNRIPQCTCVKIGNMCILFWKWYLDSSVIFFLFFYKQVWNYFFKSMWFALYCNLHCMYGFFFIEMVRHSFTKFPLNTKGVKTKKYAFNGINSPFNTLAHTRAPKWITNRLRVLIWM